MNYWTRIFRKKLKKLCLFPKPFLWSCFCHIYWLWKWHVYMQLCQFCNIQCEWVIGIFEMFLHKMCIYRCTLYYEDRDWKVANINQLIVEPSHNIPKILGGTCPLCPPVPTPMKYCVNGLIQDGWITLNQATWNGRNYYYQWELIQTLWWKYYMWPFDVINYII